MYWAYLIAFTFMTFIPTIIRDGYAVFNVVQVQEFTILLLGSIGFIMFLIMEKRLKQNKIEKAKFQKQVSRMTKDLKQSYSYIGEINRKLDILEHIAIGFPESTSNENSKQADYFDSIMGAIQVFGKSDEFALHFIQKPGFKLLKEVKSFPELVLGSHMKSCEENKHYCETEQYITITSPREIDDIFSCIVIRKNQATNQIEDPEMMKTLAAQALLLFMFMEKKKQKK